MAERDTDLHRAVEVLRHARSPAPGAKARVHARLEAALLGPGGGEFGQELGSDAGFDPGSDGGLGGGLAAGSTASAQAGGGLMFAAKVVGATVSLAGAGILTLKLGAVAVSSLSGGSVEQPNSPLQQIEPESDRASGPRDRSPADAEPDPEALVETEPTAAAPAIAGPARARAPASGPADGAPPPEPDQAPDIHAELAVIEAARRGSTPAARIASLREHAERFPDGALRDEREALWAIASCERDDFDDAQQRTRALAARRPSSPLLARIATACPDLAAATGAK
jgi:hypothetical protein